MENIYLKILGMIPQECQNNKEMNIILFTALGCHTIAHDILIL
jgi:hypothetical protein